VIVFAKINFTNWYLHGNCFTYIRPPLAKLIMTLVAWFACYKGEIHFSEIGNDL
jgi:dolichyl-phosphate-mannose-protein mannosyltransferase